MRLTPPPFEIDPEHPFLNDALSREQFGVSLTNLIKRINERLVICIDAPWGEGKTTFVKMWRGSLAKDGIKSVYFDAFANDYIDDAFIAIINEIVSLVEKEAKENASLKPKLEDLKNKASKVGAQILSFAARFGVKAATLGLLKNSDIEELEAIKDEIASGASDIASKFIRDKIANHTAERENICSFRENLQELAQSIIKDSGNPLVIIIDELDRCKPTYAIEVIERIKHLFSVEGIVFVLSMNKQQLEETIKCVYGQKIDAINYLQKFIDVVCVLPKDRKPRQLNDFRKYCDRLFREYELDTWDGRDNLIVAMSVLARAFDLSLRQLEKCFACLAIFYASIREGSLWPEPIIAFLSIIKTISPYMYDQLQRKQLSYQDLVASLNIVEFISDDNMAADLSRIMFWVKLCVYTDVEFTSSNQKDQMLKQFENISFHYHIERRDAIPYICSFFDIAQVN